MKNNNQGEEMSENTAPAEAAPEIEKKWGVQFTVLLDVAEAAQFKDESGHGQNKIERIRVEKLVRSKPMDGACGPFDTSEEASAMLKVLCQKENFLGGFVGPMSAAPAPEQQVPASEDVIREMVKQGKVPGVSPDAEVRVEPQADEGTPMPDNLVAFPGAGAQPE